MTDSIYSWQLDIGAGFGNIPNSAGSPNSTWTYFMVPNNVCYRFLYDGIPGVPDTSSIYCITVDDSSHAGTITGGGPQCGVANGTLTVNGANGNPSGWYSSTASANGPFGSLSNTTVSQTFSVTSTTYFAYITTNGVCPADTTVNTISITPYSNAGTISPSLPSNVCTGTNSTTLSSAGAVGTASASQGWQSASAATGPWSSLNATAATYTASNLSSTTYYHYIVQSGICPPDTSTPVVINVDQPAVGGSLSGGTFYCGVPPATGTLTLTGHSGTISWETSPNGVTGWGPAPGGCTGTTCNYSISPPPPKTFYRVRVTNGACPVAYSTLDSVLISPPTIAGTLTDTQDTLCAFNGTGLMNISGHTGNSFQWQISTNGGSTWSPYSGVNASSGYINMPAGNYMFQCIVQNNFCPPAITNTVGVVYNPSPTVNIITDDTIVEPGQTITVIAVGSGNPVWTPAGSVSNPNSFTTTITPFFPTDYVITVDDGSGCSDTDTLHVFMTIPPFTGFIANTLTPNNDSINDAFYVENIQAYPVNKLEIFNEYGQPIYSASPYKNDWKGTHNGDRVPDGTYYYVLTLTDIAKKKEYKGFITILGGK